MTPEQKHADVTRKVLDTKLVKESLKRAARAVILEHIAAGEPIVIWRDHQIVIEDAQVSQ